MGIPRRWAPGVVVVTASCLLCAPRTFAQEFQLDRYDPAERPRDGFAISRPNAMGHMRLGAQLHLNYALNPLVTEATQGDAGTELDKIVEHQLVGNFGFAFGLWDRLLLYTHLPVVFVMDGTGELGGVAADGAGLGDFYLGGRVRIYGEDDGLLSLGLQARLTFPTAEAANSSQNLSGDATISGHPEVLFEIRPGPVRITANLGMRIRSAEEVTSVKAGTELTYGLGAAIDILDGDVDLDAHLELFGASTLSGFFEREETPLELLAGLKGAGKSGLIAGLAAGPGLLRGVGTPDIRIVGMIGWQPNPEPPPPPPPPPPPDTDGDGLLDADDGCPTEPEDFDRFEDEDGCPDPDNDGDGVLDGVDGAPMVAEDIDGFEDEDGVPDPDNDGDGVLDAADECPIEAGVIENRGCPDSDRDGDTVVDRLDNCPDEPGSVENYGCKAEQKVVIHEGRLEILDKVFFATGRSAVKRRSYALLLNVARVINNHPEITRIQVEGHTDATGSRERNIRLSEARAEKVVRFLVETGQVDPARLEAVGYGPDRPIIENARTRDEHAENRRVEFTIVKEDP